MLHWNTPDTYVVAFKVELLYGPFLNNIVWRQETVQLYFKKPDIMKMIQLKTDPVVELRLLCTCNVPDRKRKMGSTFLVHLLLFMSQILGESGVRSEMP
ncbi:hypothetical protein CEXT_48731 [Caerostris extrusa]|uniref:Uncharacterized protein n=1 Tax=Caerostris extrusa TaxID=172846 RepID=A0AAV4SA86_CAEEX|nr:hypothetical protein CEXT_48731 [Caerostris extrusa]